MWPCELRPLHCCAAMCSGQSCMSCCMLPQWHTTQAQSFQSTAGATQGAAAGCRRCQEAGCPCCRAAGRCDRCAAPAGRARRRQGARQAGKGAGCTGQGQGKWAVPFCVGATSSWSVLPVPQLSSKQDRAEDLASPKFSCLPQSQCIALRRRWLRLKRRRQRSGRRRRPRRQQRRRRRAARAG